MKLNQKLLSSSLLLIGLLSLFSTQISDLQENHSSIDSENAPKASGALEWVDIPTTSSKYMKEPDPMGDVGNPIIYSFSIDGAANYSLNVSAYYKTLTIDGGMLNYLNSTKEYCEAYYTEAGTWIFILLDRQLPQDDYYFRLGYGNNVSKLTWKTVGQVNDVKYFSVAGNETGDIRIVYSEEEGDGGKDFKGIKYFNTTDWGTNWDQGTLANYTESENIKFWGTSITEFNGNYSCAWSISNDTQSEPKRATIWESFSYHNEQWSTPGNLTALLGKFCYAPQLFHNQSADNGTLFIAYNQFPDPSQSTVVQNITVLGNGLDEKKTGNWSIFSHSTDFDSIFDSSYDTLYPVVYCTFDNITKRFFFVDRTTNYQGIKNATFGQNLENRLIDPFTAECERSFNLFAKGSPKCFSGKVQREDGATYPGVLESAVPFNIRQYSGHADPYNKISHVFDGTYESGGPSFAEVFSFDIYVKNGSKTLDFNDLLVFVDKTGAEVTFYPFSSEISPFSSLGTKDEFKLYVHSDKQGTYTFNVKSSEEVSGEVSITERLEECKYPELCGDGINNFLFFTQKDSNGVYYLTMVKSEDGGLSWGDKMILKSSINNKFIKKHSFVSGAYIYLWSEGYLFYSTDYGKTFEIDEQYDNAVIQGVSEDGTCWKGDFNESNTKEYILYSSQDFGYTFNRFCNFTFPNGAADEMCLEAAAFDMIYSNYSFLLYNDTLNSKEIYFVVTNPSGDQYQISENLLTDGDISVASTYEGFFDLKSRKINKTVVEWVITTSAKNSINQYGYTELAYRTSYSTSNLIPNRNLDLTGWSNYTEITGEHTMVYKRNYYYTWDIIFPYEESPCFVTIYSTYPSDKLRVTAKSNLVYGVSDSLDSMNQAQITFKGLTSAGDVLDDGEYTWTCVVTDRAGYRSQESGTITIDNTLPSLLDYINLTTPKNPYPTDIVKISIPINETNPSVGKLYYKIPDGDWQSTTISIQDFNSPYMNYTGNIPAQESEVDTVYWKVEVSDTCGNTLWIDNDGSLFSYSRGIFETVAISEPVNPTLYDNWSWTYSFSSGLNHLGEVFLRSQFEKEGSVQTTKSMINPIDQSNSTYSVDITYNLEFENATYKFMYATDIGEEHQVSSIFCKKPNMRIQEEIQPPEEIDLSLTNNLTLSFVVPDYSGYVSKLILKYKFDNGLGFENITMRATGSTFKYTFDNFSRDSTLLNYTVIGEDIYGVTFTLDKLQKYNTIRILPALPSWEMTPAQQGIAGIVSAVVGVGCAIVYSTVVSRKSAKRVGMSSLSGKLKKKELEGLKKEGNKK